MPLAEPRSAVAARVHAAAGGGGGVGTFFAQATATGFVSQAATADRGSASGIYLACYFAGGLVGTAILGQLFDQVGWPACVGGIGISLGVAALLAFRLKMTPDN